MAKKNRDGSIGQIFMPAAPKDPQSDWKIWGEKLIDLSIMDPERAFNYLQSQGRLPADMTLETYRSIHDRVLAAGKK